MFGSAIRKKDVAWFHAPHIFTIVIPVVHVRYPVQNHEDLVAVIYVPSVRLVRPVQARRDAVHIGNRERIPCLSGSKISGGQEFHYNYSR